MAKQAKGIKSLTCLALESAYGSTPAENWYQLSINKNALTGSQTLITPSTITGRRDSVEPALGQIDVAGQLELPLDVRGIGVMLKGILGAPVTTSAGAEGKYQHIFKPGDELPSFTVEKGFPDIGLYYLYNGVKFDKFSLTAQVGNNETTYTVDTMASNETEAKATAAKSPTKLDLTRFNAVNATVKEGGQILGTCRKMQLDINNNCDGDTYCLNGSATRPSINEGLVEITGNLEALFQDDSLLQKAINGTETSLELIFTNGDNTLTFTIPEVLLERTTPGIDGPKGITQTLNFRAYYNNSDAGAIIVVTLVNDVATY